MAQRSDLGASIAKAIPSVLRLRRPQAEEPGAVPLCPGDQCGDLGEAGERLAAVSKAGLEDDDAVGLSIPRPHEFGARLDPPGQFQAPVGFSSRSVHELIQKPLGGRWKAAIGPFLDTVGDAATK